MSQITDTAKDKLSDVGDRAQDMTDTVKERASDMADQAQWQAQRARGWLERTWNENPLVVAGAALAGGALIGLSIPSTAAERQMMGEASGNVLQKAADTAQDATQNVSAKAQQAMNQVDQKTTSQQSSASGSQKTGAGGGSSSSQSAEEELRNAQQNIDSARSSLESGSGSQSSTQSQRGSSGSTR